VNTGKYKNREKAQHERLVKHKPKTPYAPHPHNFLPQKAHTENPQDTPQNQRSQRTQDLENPGSPGIHTKMIGIILYRRDLMDRQAILRPVGKPLFHRNDERDPSPPLKKSSTVALDSPQESWTGELRICQPRGVRQKG